MGFLSGTKRTGGFRFFGPVCAVAIAVSLVACQSTSPVAVKPKPALAGATVAAPPEATQPAMPAIPAEMASFAFDQIKGVPTGKQDILARSIAKYAQTRHLRLVRRTDTTATYHVWGYLSAVGGDVGINVTYVWDILDQNGNRVLRFSGVESASAVEGDPWTGVDGGVLDTIAERTVEDVYAWINRLPAAAGTAGTAATMATPSGTL